MFTVVVGDHVTLACIYVAIMRDRSPFSKFGQSIDWTELVVKLTVTYCSVIVKTAFVF